MKAILSISCFVYHGSGPFVIAVEKNIKWPKGGQPVARRPLKTWKYLSIPQVFLKLKHLTWEAQGKNPECSKEFSLQAWKSI